MGSLSRRILVSVLSATASCPLWRAAQAWASGTLARGRQLLVVPWFPGVLCLRTDWTPGVRALPSFPALITVSALVRQGSKEFEL